MKRFKKIYVEITNVCNLNCSFCPKTVRPHQFMDISAFEHIVKQISAYTDYIYLHILGEPLLHPKLQEILQLCNQYGLMANITSNGTLIQNKKTELLHSKALRQINFSLHSFDDEDCSLNSYIDPIVHFIQEASEIGNLIISLRLWNLQGSSSCHHSYNSSIFEYLEKKLELPFSIEEKLKLSSRIKLMNNLYLNLAQEFDWPDIQSDESSSKGFCYGLRDQIGVLVDGTVVPCCLDNEGTISLGNIFISSFDKILESPRAAAIYEGFSRREAVEELCQKCGYRSRFNKG
jgi:radical SAM protein with 4Fe4S-binding SPASM domain